MKSFRLKRLALNSFVLSALLFACIERSSAQNQFNAGLIGGLTATQVDGDNYGGFNKLGFSVGGFTNTYFSDDFGAQMEILILQKGSRKTQDPDNGDFTAYTMKLLYAEVPLLLKYKWKGAVIEAGPSFGRLLSSSEENLNGVIPNTLPFKDWEIGMNLGAAYAFSDHFDLNLRLSNSLVPIRGFAAGPLPPNFSLFDRIFSRGQYNTVLQVLARYQF